MRTVLSAGLLIAAVGVPLLAMAQQPQQPPAPPPPSVKVGEAAPDFTLNYIAPVADGKVERREVKLSAFKSKQNVVLAFFPAAFSPG
jgi:hypothetical protein